MGITRKCVIHHVHQLLEQPFGGLTLTLQHIKQLGVANSLLENLLRDNKAEIGLTNLLHRGYLYGTLLEIGSQYNEM